eukprot:TRINITY_DN65829_c0_g1_i1.p1 TRINITY_DN65829_c0_g1~~TRINITY_DN65829_c0_g1_i1.p1  ORF type:complete len:248 (-),score=34.00 TRINITY_DN65829_c0_g1_i1:67-810(-)
MRGRAKARRNYACLHRINSDVASILQDRQQPQAVQDAATLVLGRRQQALWTTSFELLVAAVSFAGYDLRHSPLVLAVSSVLFLLAALGLHGVISLNQKELLVHTLVIAALSAAICVNFVIETLLGTVGQQTAHMPPTWLLLLFLVLPYGALLCLSVGTALLSLALHELWESLEDGSSLSSEEIEMNAEALEGQDVCCVCAAARKDAALVPCGHKAMCFSCSQLVQARGLLCPVCRAPIQNILRVYDA